MTAGARIGAFASVLALIFVLALLAGAAVGPTIEPAEGDHEEEHEAAGHQETEETLPGLAVASGGYRLVPDRDELAAGSGRAYDFRIVDSESGETVRDFDTEHARRMHLIVVRRDFADFQHLHPRRRADGSWGAELNLDAGGAYRTFADFAVDGESVTLAADLFAAGRFEPIDLPPQSTTTDAGDGYEVEIDSPDPRAGVETTAGFVISRKGRELTGVAPYLGADGHLVVLREHDQAFLHTHPEGDARDGGTISFGVTYPTPGTYRLFLQFKHGGEVRTAAFTQRVGITP